MVIVVIGLAFWLGVRLDQPFAFSAIASTVAIVFHAAARRAVDLRRIAKCYAAGLFISVVVSVGGHLCGLPPLLGPSLGSAVVAVTPLGRIHPPTACIPLAVIVTAKAGIAELGLRWLLFASFAYFCLGLLAMLARPLRDPNATPVSKRPARSSRT
ncbi:hypothetical protein M1247_33975 [Mycobacterium sp. 21AC1]|uniref:hypothetical protein n=1 Tax=[Mycobacterium] appelbergii TaxID=2939269 RepID=UPI002938DC2B|nr:hypothetical protein [Mycobacterium sp. 21AC1]MDV3129954.1 hypothetical protein [Mycobacterium sp. 21AC1]